VLIGLYGVAHFAVRRLAPRADGTLLPLAALLNGIGFVVITRIDRDAQDQLAPSQAVWTMVGVAAFIGTLWLVRRVHLLERYRYTFLFLGLFALLLPLAPGLGREINGARLWVRLGSVNFQPGELAKVFLVICLAGYLVGKREVRAAGGRRIAGLRIPAARHLGPLVLAWGFSLVVMIRQKDLGSSLLFFAVFAVMLYIATERPAFLVAGAGMFVTGAAVGYAIFGHVQERVSVWANPWPVAGGNGYQIVQSLFSFGSGGFAPPGLRSRPPMNRAIRRVGIGVTVLVLLLVGQLTYLQVYDADHLANDPRNIRFQLRDFSKPRGRIVSADGQIVARSVETGDGPRFKVPA